MVIGVGSQSFYGDDHLEVVCSILTTDEIQEYLTLVPGIRTGTTSGFNKGRSSKFRVGSRVWQTPEEGLRTYRPKRCGNNNKNEDNSPKTLNDKNHQASTQKFRQLRTDQYPSFVRHPYHDSKNLFDLSWRAKCHISHPKIAFLGKIE